MKTVIPSWAASSRRVVPIPSFSNTWRRWKNPMARTAPRRFSPSIGMPDDHEAYNRVQEGLVAQATDWVDLARDAGRDHAEGEWLTAIGTSELPMRNQYRNWLRYMAEEA